MIISVLDVSDIRLVYSINNWYYVGKHPTPWIENFVKLMYLDQSFRSVKFEVILQLLLRMF